MRPAVTRSNLRFALFGNRNGEFCSWSGGQSITITACASAKEGNQAHFVKRMAKIVLAALLLVTVCGQAFGLHEYIPANRPRRTLRRRGHLRRARWNPVFRPSRDSLLRQNAEIDRMDLPRIQDDAQLQDLIADNQLVPIEASESLRIEPSLDPKRRFCRPWTRDFLEDLSNAYYEEFQNQIQVNSAVRTVKVQKKLRRRNRNAAPYKGDTASSHLAGITVDIQRRGMTRDQIKWVQDYLMPLKEQGLIEPEEERRHWCFHIAVSGRYSDWRRAQLEVQTQAANRTQSDDGDVQPPDPLTIVNQHADVLAAVERVR